MAFLKVVLGIIGFITVTVGSGLVIGPTQTTKDIGQPLQNFNDQLQNNSFMSTINATEFSQQPLSSNELNFKANKSMEGLDIFKKENSNNENSILDKNVTFVRRKFRRGRNLRSKRGASKTSILNNAKKPCETLTSFKDISNDTVNRMSNLHIIHNQTNPLLAQPNYDGYMQSIISMKGELNKTIDCSTWDACNLIEPIVLDVSKIYFYSYRLKKELEKISNNMTNTDHNQYLGKIENESLHFLKLIMKRINSCTLKSKKDQIKKLLNKNSPFDPVCNSTIYDSNNHKKHKCDSISGYRTLYNVLNENLLSIFAERIGNKYEQRRMVETLQTNISKQLADIDNLKYHTCNVDCCQKWNSCYNVDYLVYEMAQLYFCDYKRLKFMNSLRYRYTSRIETSYAAIKSSVSKSLWLILSKLDECNQTLNVTKPELNSIISYCAGFLDENYGRKIGMNENNDVMVFICFWVFWLIGFFLMIVCKW